MNPAMVRRFLARVALAGPLLSGGCSSTCPTAERTEIRATAPSSEVDGGICSTQLSCGPLIPGLCVAYPDSCEGVPTDG